MAAVTFDFNQVLIYRVTAVIATIFVVAGRAYANLVVTSVVVIVRHKKSPLDRSNFAALAISK